jgi:hypothetical protein
MSRWKRADPSGAVCELSSRNVNRPVPEVMTLGTVFQVIGKASEDVHCTL